MTSLESIKHSLQVGSSCSGGHAAAAGPYDCLHELQLQPVARRITSGTASSSSSACTPRKRPLGDNTVGGTSDHTSFDPALARAVQLACGSAMVLPPDAASRRAHAALWQLLAAAQEALLLLRVLTRAGLPVLHALMRHPACLLHLQSAVQRAAALAARPPFVYSSSGSCLNHGVASGAPALRAWAAQCMEQWHGKALRAVAAAQAHSNGANGSQSESASASAAQELASSGNADIAVTGYASLPGLEKCAAYWRKQINHNKSLS